MNRQKRKALIIGCGIAGPVVALFLQRAGIEAEIYETRAEHMASEERAEMPDALPCFPSRLG